MPIARFGLMNGLLLLNLWGLSQGGAWAWAGFAGAMTVSTLIDEIVPDDTSPPEAAAASARTRLLDALLYLTLPLVLLNLIALAHLIGTSDPFGWSVINRLLGGDLEAARAATGPLSLGGALLGFGLLTGGAGTNVAHELIHRTSDRAALLTGRWLLAFSFDTTFSIEHVHGHHRRIGMADDPATARRGEAAWSFVWRATRDGNISAWHIERERLQRRGLPAISLHNRVLTGQLMSVALALLVFGIGGVAALAAFALTAVQGKAYLELVDYIEHYGLVRVPGAPVEARHAWDTPRLISNGLLYNLPRHAHHHMFAGKPFWRLERETAAPQMPHGYMTMMLIALVSPLWRRMMDPRVADWDRTQASPAEREMLGGQSLLAR
jgi:fatty acid desaturase